MRLHKYTYMLTYLLTFLLNSLTHSPTHLILQNKPTRKAAPSTALAVTQRDGVQTIT